MAIGSLAFCLASCLFHFFRLIRRGKPVDYARPAGNASKGVAYAFTGAMDPRKKESAFLHLPTYAAGLAYHSGTFLSLLLFVPVIGNFFPTGWPALLAGGWLAISFLCGLGILLKRMVKKELSSLSSPDDYISNILVTLFQAASILVMWSIFRPEGAVAGMSFPLYYLTFSVLMLYIPAGKLRHLVYFFAARYHLGYFFGTRGTWPPASSKPFKS